MSEEKTKITIDLSDAIWAIGIITFIILFTGQPDLWDVLIHKLSDGQVPLPMPD